MVGCVDLLTTARISGWAKSNDVSIAKTDVVTDGATFVTGLADSFRADVGGHAFDLPIDFPWRWTPRSPSRPTGARKWRRRDLADKRFPVAVKHGPGNVQPAWAIAETGAFNADILWRNTNGNVAILLMSSFELLGSIMGNVPAA